MPTDPTIPVLLLVLGLLLMVVEVAIIPGFGLAGVLGLILLGSGTVIIWAVYGATIGALSLLLSSVISALLIWIFFKSRASRLLVREEKILGDSSDVPSLTHLLGRTGVVTRPLRPSGTVEIDDEPYDVISEGQFIDQGAAVVVIRISTNSIVVDRQNEGG